MENTNTFSSASTPKRASYHQVRSAWDLLPPPQAPGSGKLCPQGPLTPTGGLQAFSLLCSCFQTVFPTAKPATRFGDQDTRVAWLLPRHSLDTAQGVVGHWFSKKWYIQCSFCSQRTLNTPLHEKDLDGLHTDKTASNWGHSSKTEHSPSTHKALTSVLSTTEEKKSNKYHRTNTININNWRENLSMG